MSFFKNFPIVDYRFGNESNPDRFENISLYADVIDTIKDNVAFYQKTTIQEFQRSDQLSQKLYGTPSFYWTFYLMNDHIRERGWPLNNRELLEKAQKDFPYTTLTTRTTLTDRFRIGQTITGNTSGASGIINQRRLDLGQLIIDDVSGTFLAGETISSLTIVDRPEKPINTVETIVLQSSSLEYLAARYYTDTSSNMVDIDPAVGPGAFLTEITNLDEMVIKNDELKVISVIKPSSINSVTRAFKQAIAS